MMQASVRQTNFFIKIIGTTLMVFGVISAIVQVVKFFLEPESLPTTFLALAFSLLLIYLGTKKVLSKLIYLALTHKTASKLIVFFLPIVLTILFIVLRISIGLDAWKKTNTEGGFIEYGTSLAFLLAAIFAFPIGKFFLANRNKFLGYLYYLISFGFFLVGMEEISWGQKLIGFESSEFFKNYNSQEEITIHNLVWVNEYLDKGLMFVALIAGISCLIYKLISRVKNNYRTKFLIPRWFFASFFLIVFLFFYLVEYVEIWNDTIENFQESIELVFSLGCLSFILTNFFAIGELSSKPRSVSQENISVS